MIVWAHHAQHPQLYRAAARLATAQIYGEIREIPNGTAAIICRGKLPVAVVIFHDWDDCAGVIEVTAAARGRGWVSRDILAALRDYVERCLGAQAAMFRMSASNAAARAFVRKIGGVEYVIPRLRGRDEAMIIGVVTVEAWRETGLERTY